jgi:hypothetical protein
MGISDLRLRDSVVYFAQRASDGCVKIGTTTDLDARLRRLRSEHGHDVIELIGTAPGGGYQEAQFHRALAEWRLGGEWFRPAAQVLDAAAGGLLKASDPDPFDFIGAPSATPGLSSRARQCTGKASRDELRRQIVVSWRSGLTGRQTAHMLELSSAKLTREVKLMRQLGYFQASDATAS